MATIPSTSWRSIGPMPGSRPVPDRTTPVSERDEPHRLAHRSGPPSLWWLGWALLRLFGILALLHGIFPYEHAFSSSSDLYSYAQWSHDLWSGLLPYHDFALVYPPGVIVFLGLPPVSTGVYIAEFLSVALVADALIFRALYRSGRSLGAVLWMIAPTALGPIFWARLDIFVAAALVAAILCIERRRYAWAGILLAGATLVKLWPAVLIVLVLRAIPRRSWRRFLLAATGTLVVAVLPLMALGGGAGLWHSLRSQATRGVEYESVFALPLYALQTAGHFVPIVFGLSVNFAGPAADHVATVSDAVFVCALVFCLWRALTGRSPGADAAGWLLLLATAIVLTSKVLSPQYLVWVSAAVALVVDRASHGIRLAVVTVLLLVATQVQFPLEFYQMVLGTDLGLPLSALHAIVVVFFAAIAYRSVTLVPAEAGPAPTMRPARELEGDLAPVTVPMADPRPVA